MGKQISGFVIISPKGKPIPCSLASCVGWAWENAKHGVKSHVIPTREILEGKGYRAVRVTVTIEEDDAS